MWAHQSCWVFWDWVGVFPEFRISGMKYITNWGGKKGSFYGSVVGALLNPILKEFKPVYECSHPW